MPSTNHRRSSRGGGGPPNNNKTGQSKPPAQSGNVRVVVRIRPPNPAELGHGSGSRPIVQMLDEKLLVFDPKEDAMPSYFHGQRIARRNLMQRKNRDIKFAFDRVFGQGVSQQYVYENTTKTIVDRVLAGYNTSVFAYGATGAGKTFTMLGGQDCPGVIFLTMVDLYRQIGEIAKEKLCDVAVSYLEVYNENIRDLLAPSGLLAIREDPDKGVVVNGLTLHKPRSAEELLRMLEFGNGNRTQHPTDANAQSSRSHAVFQVFVRQKDRTANISASFRVAKMSLIDLAGSERATVTTNRGARFREGANINRSLLALGNCINALADNRNKSKGQHVPYRNSKLTRLLKDSLGGNCHTVMIAAISPSSLCSEDTLNTLKYANRAKNIRTTLTQNVVSVDLHISRYAQIVEELRGEVTELKTKLQNYETGVVKVERAVPAPDDHNDERIHRFQLELHKVFAQRGSIRKELLELESSDRHLTIMIGRKQLMAERIRLVYGDSVQGDKTMGRFERHIAASSARQNRLRDRKPAVEERIKANEEWLERVKTEMKTEKEDEQIPMILQESLRTRHLEIELKDCRRQIKHLKRFARQQDSHQQSSERLIISLLSTVRKQFFLLKGSGLATSDVTSDFEAVQKQVEGDREIAWADQSMSEVAEVKPSALAEVDLNSLLELPVMKCVATTPNAPSRSPRKNHRRKSGSHTPAKKQTGQSPSQNTAQGTMVLREAVQTPMQNRTPARQASLSKVSVIHPPSRIQTPKVNTPCARRNNTIQDTIETFQPIAEEQPTVIQGVVNSSCHTGNGHISSQEVVNTPDVSQRGNKGVGNTGTGHGIPQCNQTVTKEQPSLRVLPVLPDHSDNEDAKRNLSDAFEMDGICPLRGTPEPQSQLPAPGTDRDYHVTETSQSQASTPLATMSPEERMHSESVGHSVPTNPEMPVARAIAFGQENTLPNQKISPVTGRVMSYAEILSTPQRQEPSTQRAPFAVLTNNSPQLQNRPISSKPMNAFSDCTNGSKPAGNQCTGNQLPKSATKRNLQRRGTFTKRNAPLHRRSKSQGVLNERPAFSFQEAKHAETLHRFGLPSMADQPTVGIRKPTPAYMSMTASAANKRRNNGRGGFLASQENQPPMNSRGPMRVHRAESITKPAVRITSFSKSRSASNLHSKINP